MIICICNNISRDDIICALERDISPDKVHTFHGSKPVCGLCLKCIRELYEYKRSDKDIGK